MSMKVRMALLSTGLVATTVLAGCSLTSPFTGKEKIDPPKKINYLKSDADLDEKKATAGQSEKIVQTELYLLDKNGYVVPTTVALPNTESVAKQALEYLVQDGPVTDVLPSGFQAVLPAETVVKSIDVQNGKVTADFSKEFKQYQKKNEMKILQSIVWTLTQFDSVGQVTLRVEGKNLTEMPVGHTPINQGLTRDIGINNENTQVADITNTHPLTVYFLNDNEKNSYLVPVTRRVANTEKDDVTAAVQELIKGPQVNTNLASDFLVDADLLDEPIVEGGLASLNFNQNISTQMDNNVMKVDSRLLDELVLTLTELDGIEKVSVFVNGNSELVDENGTKVAKEVSRPTKVNTGSY